MNQHEWQLLSLSQCLYGKHLSSWTCSDPESSYPFWESDLNSSLGRKAGCSNVLNGILSRKNPFLTSLRYNLCIYICANQFNRSRDHQVITAPSHALHHATCRRLQHLNLLQLNPFIPLPILLPHLLKPPPSRLLFLLCTFSPCLIQPPTHSGIRKRN